MSTELIVKEFNQKTIRVRPSDKYVCLTDMAKAAKKRYGNWAQLESTKSYLATLSSVIGKQVTELLEVNQGGIPHLQGTWGHPKVALRFAQWCSDEFAVQVDFWIDELVTTGKVELVESKPKTKLDIYKEWKETAIALVESEEQKLLLESQNNELQAEVEQLSEICDELFDYSSILRIAKYNNVSETLFTWRKLKQISENLHLEIKKAPDPRYGEKNLYHHDVWRIAYPNMMVPEMNMIVRVM